MSSTFYVGWGKSAESPWCFHMPNTILTDTGHRHFDDLTVSAHSRSHSDRMSSNVGLSTPRGSGTSGYVQRNAAHLKPRDEFKPYSKDIDPIQHRQRQPDKEILDHDRKREIEVKVFELRDKLESEE